MSQRRAFRLGLVNHAPALASSDQATYAVRRGHDDGPGATVVRGQDLDQAARVGHARGNRHFLVLPRQKLDNIVPISAGIVLPPRR